MCFKFFTISYLLFCQNTFIVHIVHLLVCFFGSYTTNYSWILFCCCKFYNSFHSENMSTSWDNFWNYRVIKQSLELSWSIKTNLLAKRCSFWKTLFTWKTFVKKLVFLHLFIAQYLVFVSLLFSTTQHPGLILKTISSCLLARTWTTKTKSRCSFQKTLFIWKFFMEKN